MVLTKGIVPGIEKPVALIGVSERICFFATFGGIQRRAFFHAGKRNGDGILSSAIERLQNHPFPARICEPVDLFLHRVGPEMSFVSKMAFANRWLGSDH